MATAEPKIRTIHRYTIPPDISKEITSVGLVELTATEELQATRRARQDAVRLAFEMAKQSLVEVNGKKLSFADNSLDKTWDELPPKVRSLILQAYGELHSPPEQASEVFLKSRQDSAG